MINSQKWWVQQLLGNQTIDKRNSALVKRQHPKLGNPEQLQKVLLAGQPKPPPEHFPSDEICSTNRQWEQINSTHDFYDNDVEVVHEEGLQQFIYTYRCASNKSEFTFQRSNIKRSWINFELHTPMSRRVYGHLGTVPFGVHRTSRVGVHVLSASGRRHCQMGLRSSSSSLCVQNSAKTRTDYIGWTK